MAKKNPDSKGGKARVALSITRVVASAGARERLERSVRATTAADDDTITLRFEFKGGPARLIELRDNETSLVITDPVGPWKYNAAHDPTLPRSCECKGSPHYPRRARPKRVLLRSTNWVLQGGVMALDVAGRAGGTCAHCVWVSALAGCGKTAGCDDSAVA